MANGQLAPPPAPPAGCGRGIVDHMTTSWLQTVTAIAPNPFRTTTRAPLTLRFDDMASRFLLLLLAACGRIGFRETPEPDAAACIAVGHDEDLDGVDDACDVCPQRADTEQLDRDGDRVGDACDPHPDDPRDQIAAFDPFTSQRPEWTFPGTQPTFTGDSMLGDARMRQFRADRVGVPATDSYTFVLRIGDANPDLSAQKQLALYALESDDQVYFCDLDDNGGGAFFAQSFTYNGVDFDAGDTTELTGPLANGDAIVTLDHDLPAATWSCTTSWPVTKPTLTSPLPPAAGGVVIDPDRISLGAIRLEIEVHSFFHVHSD